MTGTRVCHLGQVLPAGRRGDRVARPDPRPCAGRRWAWRSRSSASTTRPGRPTVEHDGPVEVTRFGRSAAAAKLDVCPDLVAAPGAGRGRRPPPARPQPDDDPRPAAAPGRRRRRGDLPQRPDPPAGPGPPVPAARAAGLPQVRAILPTSPLYPAGSRFLRPYADRLHVLPHGIDLQPYLDPSPDDQDAGRADPREHAGGGPLWLGVRPAGLLQGVPQRDPRADARRGAGSLLIGDGPERPAPAGRGRAAGRGATASCSSGTLPHYLDLVPYYLAADAFWFPSNARSEAFGLVQVEAMASGCPVINTRDPAQRRSLGQPARGDGPDRAGRRPGRPWPTRPTGCSTEPGLRDRLAAAAQRGAVEEFDHRVMAARSLAIYRHVLTGAPSRSRPGVRP